MRAPGSRFRLNGGFLVGFLFSPSLLGCGWILGLDEYSPQEACPPAKCGAFVSLEGSDTHEGTREQPVRTLARAIDVARSGNGVVQACAQEFQEAVVVPAGVTLKGGFDCVNQWAHIGKLVRTVITAGPGEVPLRLVGGSGVARIEDITVRASNAIASGESSIAVIVEQINAEIVGCDFTAGNGAAGEKGSTPSSSAGPSDASDPAIKGKDGTSACMGDASGSPGGEAISNAKCSVSIGGSGGAGGVAAADGAPGSNGEPTMDQDKGLGGAGDTGASCEPGGFGQAGAPGMPGGGASANGTIHASGYTGAAGAPGSDGSPGQGGGGGGGAKGKVACNGASGGGGGAGGCGGKGGFGGSAGGASIALISVNAALSFADVTLEAGNGGAGGEGGDGQIGGTGGNGGTGGAAAAGTFPGCDGGKGGVGGFGGKGGGGRGGHSLGIAFTGTAPPEPTKITVGTAGMGGLGADMMMDGAPGEAKDVLEFPDIAP